MESGETLLDKLLSEGLKEALRKKWEESIVHCKSKKIEDKDITKCLQEKWNNFVKPENEKNRKFELDYPPIHAAVVVGDVKIFEAMVEIEPHFYNVQIPDHVYPVTPRYYLLFLAIELGEQGHIEIVKFMMKKINNRQRHVPFESIRNLDRESPLHIAARTGNVELVRYFIDFVKTIGHRNLQDEDENTPIHSMFTHYPKILNGEECPNRQKILELLIPYSDLSIKNKKKYRALDLAIKKKLIKAVKILAHQSIPISSKTLKRCKLHLPEMEKYLGNIKSKQNEIKTEIEKVEDIQTDERYLKGRVTSYVMKRCESHNLSFYDTSSSSSNVTIKSEPPLPITNLLYDETEVTQLKRMKMVEKTV